MKIKERLKKLLVSTLIFLSIFNFIISSGSHIGIVEATSPSTTGSITNIERTKAATEALIDLRNNGVTGIISWLLRIVIVGVASVFQIETFFVADSQGNDGTVDDVFITPLHIFFNKFKLTDINIFSTDGLDPDSFVYKMRVNAALWYLVFRGIALGLMLALLLYTGLRLLVSNFGSEKAKYQQLLVNWALGLVLAFFLHMVIIFMINVNDSLISIIETAAEQNDVTDMVESIRDAAFSESYLLGTAATIVYIMMVVQTMIYLFIYIKRLLTVLFLVIISPIIAITYTLDKSNGGTAKSLNGWLREFMYNVFIQPIHCIIYVVMVGVALDALSGAGEITELESLGPAIIAILSMLFIKKAEDLLRELLGFNKSTTLMSSSNVVNSVVGTAVGAANLAATVASKGAVPFKAGGSKTPFGQNINNNTNNNVTNNSQSMFSNISNSFSNVFNNGQNGLSDGQNGGGGLGTLGLGSGSGQEDNGILGIGDGSQNSGSGDSNEKGFFELDEDKEKMNANNEKESSGGGMTGFLGVPLLNEKKDDNNNNKIANAVKKVNNNNNNDSETNNNIVNSFDKKNNTNIQNDAQFINGGIPGEQLEELIEQVRELNEKLDQLNEEKDKMQEKRDILDSIEKSMSNNEAEIIKNNIDTQIVGDNMDDAREYANSLGENTLESKYANAYIDVKETEKAEEEYNSVSNEKKVILDNAKINGVINDNGAQRLSAGDYSVGNNEKQQDNNIDSPKTGINFKDIKNTDNLENKSHIDSETSADNKVSNVENVENVEEIENVEYDEEIETELPTSEVKRTLDDAAGGDIKNILKDQAVKDETLKNIRLIEYLKGKAIVEGDLTDESLTNFNVEVVAKAGGHAYSQSNFEEARQRVKQEGEKAMGDLEKYLNDPSLTTAKELSPGGKKYAQLVAEAQQAGLVVSTARTMSTQVNQSNKAAETVVKQSQQYYSADNRTNNVLGQINERKDSNNQ